MQYVSSQKERGFTFSFWYCLSWFVCFAKGGQGVSRTITLDSKKKKENFEISCLKVVAPQWDLDHRHPKMETESWWSHPTEGRKTFPSFPLGSLDDLIIKLT